MVWFRLVEARQRRRDAAARPNRIEIRLSDAELAAVDERAAARGLARAAFMAESALGTMPAQPDRTVLLAELMAIRRRLLSAAVDVEEWQPVMVRLGVLLEEAGL